MVELPGGNGVHHLLLRRLFALEQGHALTEPQHGDPLCDLEDVVKVVRDDHDGEPLLGERPDEV